MKPQELILDHGTIMSPSDLFKLNIIDWNRYRSYWRNPQHCLEVIASHLQGLIYYVIQNNLSQYPEKEGFPDWQHAGNHVEAGKEFWNYFHYNFQGTLNFHDSPDFSGIVNQDGIERPFYGDIGKVSPIAMLDTSGSLRCGGYWISVSDTCQRLTILEPPRPERNEVTQLRTLLEPILNKLHTTSHILYNNVFIEYPDNNIYIGDDRELASFSQRKLSQRVNAAISGKWNREPVPLPYRTTLQTSDFQPSQYTMQSLWS